jgi:hypothetical protein
MKGRWQMKRRGKYVAIWSVIAFLLFLTSALPSAYGLEFPVSNSIEIEATVAESALAIEEAAPISAGALYGSIDLATTRIGTIFSSNLALVSSISHQVEMARTSSGAKKVAKFILRDEYGMGDKQFSCLNNLWTKESHWNYKAHNYRSGAHGIAQALPAEKMSVVGSDWRTNPVTQIRWGLRCITIRYESPCKAWSHFKSKRYY